MTIATSSKGRMNVIAFLTIPLGIIPGLVERSGARCFLAESAPDRWTGYFTTVLETIRFAPSGQNVCSRPLDWRHNCGPIGGFWRDFWHFSTAAFVRPSISIGRRPLEKVRHN